MDRKKITSKKPGPPQPYVIRLSSFIRVNPIGLGDVIKRATTSMGIKPCSGCQKRAEALNKRVVFAKQG